MGIAETFRDYLGTGATPDENTVLADYWLDFVSVREEAREPSFSRQTADALSGQLQDIERRIAALKEYRNQILEMLKVAQAAGPNGTSGKEADIEIPGLPAQRESPADHASLPDRRALSDRLQPL
jgi:hypothetical protein